jgi:hypothetical protein
MRKADRGVCSVGFITTVVPSGKGGCKLPCLKHQRKVPGKDLTDYAHRLLTCVAKVVTVDRDRLALNLVSPAGEVPVAGYSGSNIDGFRDGEWHTVVQGFKTGKIIGVVFNKVGETVEQTSSL